MRKKDRLINLRTLCACSALLITAGYFLGAARAASTACQEYDIKSMGFKFGTPELPGGMLLIDKPSIRCQSAAGTGQLSTIDGIPSAPLRPDIQFPIASNTKMFTASVILQLVQEGKLKLEDKAVWYFSDQVYTLTSKIPHINEITVLDLLRHSSGIPDFLSQPRFASTDCIDKTNPACNSARATNEEIEAVSRLTGYSADLLGQYHTFLMETWFFKKNWGIQLYFDPVFDLAFAVTHGVFDELNFLPGTQVGYSNTDYLLLGLMIENIEKSSIDKVFKTRIRDRIGLDQTFSLNRENPSFKMPLHLYLAQNDYTEYFSGMVGFTDDGLIGTLSDLNRFMRAFIEGRLFNTDASTVIKFFKKHGIDTQTKSGVVTYSTGVMSIEVPDGNQSRTVYYHTGEDPGVLSISASIPECNGSLVAMINQSAGDSAITLLGNPHDHIDGIFQKAVKMVCASK